MHASRKDGDASFHEPLHLLPWLLSSRDARGTRTRQLPLQQPRQSLLLSCACGHAQGLSPTCASHAIIQASSRR